MNFNFTILLDLLGKFAFAISGIRSASGKQIDWFGALQSEDKISGNWDSNESKKYNLVVKLKTTSNYGEHDEPL